MIVIGINQIVNHQILIFFFHEKEVRIWYLKSFFLFLNFFFYTYHEIGSWKKVMGRGTILEIMITFLLNTNKIEHTLFFNQ